MQRHSGHFQGCEPFGLNSHHCPLPLFLCSLEASPFFAGHQLICVCDCAHHWRGGNQEKSEVTSKILETRLPADKEMIRQAKTRSRDRCRMSPVQLSSYCLSAPDPPFHALLCDTGAGILETLCSFASSPLLVSAKWGECPGGSCKPGRGKGTALPVSFCVIPESITPASRVHLGHACFFLSSPGAYQVTLAVKKNLPTNAGDLKGMGSVPRLGRSSAEGNDNPLQYSCLENSMDRGALLVTAHGVQRVRLSTTHTPTFLPVTPVDSSLQGVFFLTLAENFF